MTELTRVAVFTSPVSERALRQQRDRHVQLIAALALTGSLIVAATAVSIGATQAHALHAPNQGARVTARL